MPSSRSAMISWQSGLVQDGIGQQNWQSASLVGNLCDTVAVVITGGAGLRLTICYRNSVLQVKPSITAVAGDGFPWLMKSASPACLSRRITRSSVMLPRQDDGVEARSLWDIGLGLDSSSRAGLSTPSVKLGNHSTWTAAIDISASLSWGYRILFHRSEATYTTPGHSLPAFSKSTAGVNNITCWNLLMTRRCCLRSSGSVACRLRRDRAPS